MQHSFEEVSQIAHTLPEEQRIQLANALYESVASDEDTGSEAEIAAAWDDEIKRRIDEIDSGAVRMIPLEDALADMDSHIAAKRRR
jgi:putative addiction module component (TIGR02574 family)